VTDSSFGISNGEVELVALDQVETKLVKEDKPQASLFFAKTLFSNVRRKKLIR
jgi:hypothetical protein